MSRLIPQGAFSEVVKTGVYFSLNNDDRVFTGDLYYNFATREFQMRGVPSFEGRMRHVFDAKFKGPVRIDLWLKSTIEIGSDAGIEYSVVTFRQAKVSSELATHLEEWHGDRSVMAALEEFWEIKPDLTWYKG